MNNEIKEIVSRLEIHEKKLKLLDNKKRLFELDRKMAKLKFDRNIGLYAFYVDEMNYLISTMENTTPKKREEILNKLKQLEFEAMALTAYPGVEEYASLRDEYYDLLYNNDYHIAVNIELRNELSNNMELPLIYVEQSHFDFDKHIINKTPLVPSVMDEKNATFVAPIDDIESVNNYKSFYNKVSFKYLEQLCNDYSFELKGKNLGTINIRGLKKLKYQQFY